MSPPVEFSTPRLSGLFYPLYGKMDADFNVEVYGWDYWGGLFEMNGNLGTGIYTRQPPKILQARGSYAFSENIVWFATTGNFIQSSKDPGFDFVILMDCV